MISCSEFVCIAGVSNLLATVVYIVIPVKQELLKLLYLFNQLVSDFKHLISVLLLCWKEDPQPNWLLKDEIGFFLCRGL